MKAIKTLAIASLISGCTMGDNETPPVMTPAGSAVGSASGSAVPVANKPATCADVLAADASAVDGDYTLYIGGDASKPWQAYCWNMAGSPAEYLPLVMVMGDHNFSQYTSTPGNGWTDVRTSFLRVRIDPATLKIDIGDETFTSSTGLLYDNGIEVDTMPFGVAMSCSMTPGLANIDLRGTSFALASRFSPWGASPAGVATLDAAEQVLDLTGSGLCGWSATVDTPADPINFAHAWAIQLSYAP